MSRLGGLKKGSPSSQEGPAEGEWASETLANRARRACPSAC